MTNYNKKISDTEYRLGEVRFSYAHVFVPQKTLDGSKDKYGVSIVIPKTETATLALIREGIEAAKQKGISEKWGGKLPNGLKLCLRDGDIDRPDDEAYAGCWFFNASSERKPGVRVLSGKSIVEALDEEDFYSGCYGAVTVNFFPFNSNGSKGVSAGLGNLIKTRDGERLSGGRSAEADFGDLGGADDYLD